MKLNWNFQGGGGLRKNHFCQGGMDIFWSYTSEKNPKYLFQLIEKQIAADNLIVQWLSLEQSLWFKERLKSVNSLFRCA